MAPRRSLLARMTTLPVRLGERIGLLDHVPPGLPEGAPPPRHTFRWDLDKTYLRTEFESLRKMVRIPFESAADKVALPGVPQLIQALRRCAGARGERPLVFFLSASPPQIGAAIREKLALDGIEYEGITFKDQLRNLMRGRWRNLREQVGYKLGELLESRLRVPDSPREVLFGDDWESDPLIYSLYADVMNGALAPEQLVEIIARLGVDTAAVERIAAAAKRVPEETPGEVARIFINLERRTPPGRFHAFGSRLVPAFNYLQTAASLFEMGFLDEGALPVVAGAAPSRQPASTVSAGSTPSSSGRSHSVQAPGSASTASGRMSSTA